MFLRTIHLTAYAGLPFSKIINFDEVDPASALHTRALDITGRTLKAQIDGRPKAKAYEIEILEDPPAPGDYEFLLIYAGIEHEVTVTLPAGGIAKDLQTLIIDAIKALLLSLNVCKETCSDTAVIEVASPWPGLEWSLALVSQPEAAQVDVDLVQDNAPLVAFTVSSAVVVDKLAVTLSLSTAQTGAIPVAGDGPYRWRLTAVAVDGDVEDPDDALLLAHGMFTIGRA